MKLSIIILNFHCPALTEKCLASIFADHLDIPFEIIVVDNESRDEEILHLQEKYTTHRNITWIYSPKNLGYGQGNELGVRVARGEYILILNPDIEVHHGTIQKMVEAMDIHRDVGLIAPQLMYPDSVVQDSYRRFPRIFDIIIKRTPLRYIPVLRRRLDHFLMRDKDPMRVEDVDWVVGAAMMVRREALKDVRYMFDPRFFLFFEDTDLCRRMWEQGWRVMYFPDARAFHHHERLSAGGIFDIFRKKVVRIHIVSGVKYFWKYLFKKAPR